MTTYLVDVNVWLAQTYTAHVHHAIARGWLEESAGTIIFCRVTQTGLLRLLTNRRVMGDDVLDAPHAWRVYDALRRNSRIAFAPEPQGLETTWRSATRHAHTGPNFWTDAYLAAFAAAAGLTVVTFDNAFRQFTEVQVLVLKAG